MAYPCLHPPVNERAINKTNPLNQAKQTGNRQVDCLYRLVYGAWSAVSQVIYDLDFQIRLPWLLIVRYTHFCTLLVSY